MNGKNYILYKDNLRRIQQVIDCKGDLDKYEDLLVAEAKLEMKIRKQKEREARKLK